MLSLLPIVSFGQEIVYDNSSTSLDNNMPLLPSWRNDSAEAGDDIWLSGTDRQITSISMLFTYRGTEAGTLDLRLRFRDVDELTQHPGEIIYESDLKNVQTVHGLNRYTFDVPNVLVPDHVIWTVQAYNRQGSVGELGPAYYNPATVGFSDDFFWLSDMGSPWINYSWGGEPYANFGATITAVPEPATMLGLVLGLSLLRRRKKNV